MSGERFYVDQDAAAEMLRTRTPLRDRVECWWAQQGFAFPDVFARHHQIGFVSRHLATARFEDAAFVVMAELMGLRPVWSTYIGDEFVTFSPVKCSYVQPLVFDRFAGKPDKPEPVLRKVRLANPECCQGERLNRIMVQGGSSLVAWHQNRLLTMYPGALVTDPTEIYRRLGGARNYYVFLLSLAAAHGVLFEDFHGGETGEPLMKFTREIFEPAFDKVAELFGAPPVVVRLPWWRELGYYVSEADLVNGWRDSPALKHLARAHSPCARM